MKRHALVRYMGETSSKNVKSKKEDTPTWVETRERLSRDSRVSSALDRFGGTGVERVFFVPGWRLFLFAFWSDCSLTDFSYVTTFTALAFHPKTKNATPKRTPYFLTPSWHRSPFSITALIFFPVTESRRAFSEPLDPKSEHLAVS